MRQPASAAQGYVLVQQLEAKNEQLLPWCASK
jgi:hypothetical protein